MNNDSAPRDMFVGREKVRCLTQNRRPSAFWFHLKKYGVKVNKYTLRHFKSQASNHLRNWVFQGSNNGYNWITLREHKNDLSLKGISKSVTFSIDKCDEYYSWFRILMTGPIDNNLWNLACSGNELYGDAQTSFREMDEIIKEKYQRDAKIVEERKKRCLAQIIKTAGTNKKQRPIPSLGSIQSDGKYLYIHCDYGLFKIGTGFHDSENGKIYAKNTDFFNGQHSQLLV